MAKVSILLVAGLFASFGSIALGGYGNSNEKIDKFWPDKCSKYRQGRSADSSEDGSSENSSAEKVKFCPAWKKWVEDFNGACDVSDVCKVLVRNTKTGETFPVTRSICSGGCPANSQCQIDDSFCTLNKTSFVCLARAFTSKGQIVSVFRCRANPTTTTPTTTPTTTTTTVSQTATTIPGGYVPVILG